MPAQINIFDEITVDGFCGGGGWSTGFELAIGEPVTIGINHDAAAISMHKANHPATQHYNENIFLVDPKQAVAGRAVGWAHFSPDCTHFSVAKGGKPVKKHIRGLAWVITKWAGTVHPRIISMENVPEFMSWGPLIAKRDKATGRVLKKTETGEIMPAAPGERVPIENQLLIPDKNRKGETFRKFIREMKKLGYEVDWKVLTASDFGAPTSRKRLFIIFRRDGKPIVWPKPTHGDPESEAVKSGKRLPWRTAAECIDFDLPIESIFDRKKPLAENTLKRIARGIKKFIVNNPEPFIVQVNHGGSAFRGQSTDKPLPTITQKHGFGIVEPVVAPTIMCNNANNVGSGPQEPLHTITTANRHYLIASTLLQYHGETGKTEARGQEVTKPLQTIDTSNRYALTSAFLTKYYSGADKSNTASVEKPLATITTHDRFGVVSAFVEKTYSGGYRGAGSAATEPLGSITTKDHNRLVTAFIARQFGTSTGQKVDEPLRTITGVDKSRVVEAFLEKYDGGSNLVEIQGEKYKIVDIAMRMLTPRELYNAQGFPPDYIIDRGADGKPYAKSQQVAKVGNSVPPAFATAIVRANWPERCKQEITTMRELERVIYDVG